MAPVTTSSPEVLPQWSRWLARCDACGSTFRTEPSYREGFGTVVIEAAAMGVPTIGSDIYGLSDAIVNGETGLLVPVKNSQALAAAIDQLLGDERLCKELGEKARIRVEKEFSSQRISNLLIGEYTRLLEKDRGDS
ncbi:glycosyltransferase family 4 protein [Pseudomonas aeruginosa]|nr:glycosyltransferase family 4 protein [Pseudomonas aeruginosa]